MPIRNETIFVDPTPGAFIQNRYLHPLMSIAHEHTEMTEEEFREFAELAALVAKKLVSVWGHYRRYCEIEDELILQAKSGLPIESLEFQEIGYSQDLFLEVDEFFTQLKSALDYAAKLPRKIIGPSFQ